MEHHAIPARACLALGDSATAWVSQPAPLPGPGEVLVRTTAGAVSVGSETPVIAGRARTAAPLAYPRMTGYESVGLVERAGAGVRLAPGTRVAAFYGHRTHATVSADAVIPIPDQIDDPIALLTILTCDVWKGICRLDPEAGEHALVTGAGAIGLLAVWVLRNRMPGLAGITVLEPRPERRDLALAMGAAQALPPEARVELAADFGLECSSSAAGFLRLQEAMRRRGRICILSDGLTEPLPLSAVFHDHELSVVGSNGGDDYAANARWLFNRPASALDALRAVFDQEIDTERLPGLLTELAFGITHPIKPFVRYPSPPERDRLR